MGSRFLGFGADSRGASAFLGMKGPLACGLVSPLSAPTPYRLFAILFASLALLIPSAQPLSAQQPALPGPEGGSLLPITIRGYNSTGEGYERQWVAELRERPIANSPDGYKPHVISGPGRTSPLPVRYEQPIEFRWQFDDGTGVVSTGERPCVAHRFADDGEFTIRVEAWSEGQKFAEGTKAVSVKNRPPSGSRVSAVQVDAAESLFELSAVADDVPGDPITYNWDFGDGETLADGGWQVRHAYPIPGKYTAKVTFRDDEGGEREDTREFIVTGAGPDNGNTVGALEEAPVEAVQNSINVTVSGSPAFDFTGELRPIKGLYFMPRGNGECRFVMSAWDNAHLAHLSFIFDLKGVRDGGAVYQFQKPGIWMNLEAKGNIYAFQQKNLTGDLVMGPNGIGQTLMGLPGVGELTQAQRQDIGNKVGVEPGIPERGETAPIPAVSPLGVGEHEGFTPAGGSAELTFIPNDRAVGKLAAQLANPDEKSPFRGVSLNGEFTLDLKAARRDGMVVYDGCGPADLSIEEVSPKDGETFLTDRTPHVTAYFSGRYAPESVNESTFQLTYPAPGHGELVPVETRVYRRATSAWITPVKELLGGVEYIVRVKTGEDGVKSPAGNPIPDTDGTGWYTWKFTTKPNFTPSPESAPGTENLACHVFQTVRDAPLIAGKPAVARVYADWQRHPEVHPDAQVREFLGKVSLMDGTDAMVSETVRFVRPDLWKANGISERKAEHTANLFFTPKAGGRDTLRVRVEYPRDSWDRIPPVQWATCSTPTWHLEPKIKVMWYIMRANQWLDKDIDTEVKPWLEQVVSRAERVSQQLFPVKSVDMHFGGILRYPPSKGLITGADEACGQSCAANVLNWWQTSPTASSLAGVEFDASATAVMVILPGRPPDPNDPEMTREFSGGGAKLRVEQDGPQGFITFAFEDEPSYRERYTYGIVHELGHVLWLEHLPYINSGNLVSDRFAQSDAKRVRDQSWANGNSPAFQFEGIEGFLLSPQGGSGKNKSSTEGNEESTWMAPLMYPATLNVKDMFIARHHYLQLMQTWEKNGGIGRP